MEWTPEQLEEKMAKFANESAKLGDEWAVKQGMANSVKDRKEDYLSLLTSRAEGESHAEKERNARISTEWMEFKAELGKMSEEALQLKVKYDTSIRNWETSRSLLSSANTQRRTST